MSDFTASIAVFGFLVAAFFMSWNTLVQTDNRFAGAEEMRKDARRTAAFLVTTEGYPDDWEDRAVNVTMPGFAVRQNVLSVRKITEFANMTYSRQSNVMQAANFQIRITSGGAPMTIAGEPALYGRAPPGTADTVIVINRNVLVEKPSGIKPGELKYILWRP